MKTALIVVVVALGTVTGLVRSGLLDRTKIPFVQVSTFSKLSVEDVISALKNYPGRTLGEIDSLALGIQGQSSTIGAVRNSDPTRNLGDQSVLELTSEEPDLSNKLDSTVEALSQLNLRYQKVLGQINLINLNGDSLQASQAAESLNGSIADLDSDAQLGWLIKSWGWPELITIASQTAVVKESLDKAVASIGSAGLQPVSYLQFKSALANLESAQILIGEAGDASSTGTLYSEYHRVSKLSAELDSQQGQLNDLLTQWNKIPFDQLDAKASETASLVLSLNQIPGAKEILTSDPKNEILNLMGLVQANKTLLAQDSDKPLVVSWLLDNPLTVRTLVTNPVTQVSQPAVVKYYLPKEIKAKDILNHDSDLSVNFDTQKGKYLVSGDVVVASAEAKVVSATITDLWQFDHAKSVLSESMTPEQRIVAFRKAPPSVAGVQTSREAITSTLKSITTEQLLAIGAIMVVAGVGISFLHTPNRGLPPVRQFRTFSERISSSDL